MGPRCPSPGCGSNSTATTGKRPASRPVTSRSSRQASSSAGALQRCAAAIVSERGWKRFERDLARDVGTERIPVTGERDGADFETAVFVYSAKQRAAQFPRTVAAWLDRVVGKARSRTPGKVGVVVV